MSWLQTDSIVVIFSRGQDANHDVPVRHDSAQLSVVANDNVANIVFTHGLGGLHDWRGGVESDWIRCHNFTYFHITTSL